MHARMSMGRKRDDSENSGRVASLTKKPVESHDGVVLPKAPKFLKV